MKTKNFKKLTLNKETVSRLNDEGLEKIYAGKEPPRSILTMCQTSKAVICTGTVVFTTSVLKGSCVNCYLLNENILKQH